jgi:peroxiredoxin
MNVSSKITQKLAALLILTAGVYMSSEFADGKFVRAASENTTAAKVGTAAPDFTLTDTNGKKQTLSSYKGKLVVLEWLNHGCPFVKKHYSSGNMQALQKEYTAKDVIWLSIVSSAEGKQGFQSNAEHNAAMKATGAAPTAILIDSDGTVGHLYGAKTTPHMFVINKKGELAYAGAIDDKTSTDAEEVKTAKNYVRASLDSLLKNKTPKVASTQSYGCSVKYAQ